MSSNGITSQYHTHKNGVCIATPYRFLRLNNYIGLLGVKAWNGENAIYAIMWPILYTSILWNNMLLRASSAFAICNKPKIYTNFRRNFFAKNETTPPYMVALLLCGKLGIKLCIKKELIFGRGLQKLPIVFSCTYRGFDQFTVSNLLHISP